MERLYEGELKIEFKMSVDANLDDEMHTFYLSHEHPESILLDEINAFLESKGYLYQTSRLTLRSTDNTKIYHVTRQEQLIP
ncbi:hypothetical protein [Lysinibacillus boronitolerans]|uniref:hypothetical protein n=1 Tax=Lysinibacillus boronitolerans TaxID=309788 RepID=UPI0028A0CE80|nr:hypothetical protein [Bacillus mobilis]